MQSTTNTNTSIADQWKRCRIVGYINVIVFGISILVFAMGFIAYLYFSFVKQLSLKESNERLGLQPAIILLRLVLSCVLFHANWKITAKEIPRHENVLIYWRSVHLFACGTAIASFVTYIWYGRYYYCVCDFIGLAILMIEISIVWRFYVQFSGPDHDMAAATNMQNVL